MVAGQQDHGRSSFLSQRWSCAALVEKVSDPHWFQNQAASVQYYPGYLPKKSRDGPKYLEIRKFKQTNYFLQQTIFQKIYIIHNTYPEIGDKNGPYFLPAPKTVIECERL